MSPDDHARAAADLIDAERTGRQTGLLSCRFPEMTVDDAYAIQAKIIDAKLAAGRRIIGWKIGLTSKAMQAALEIDTPDSGVLFDDMLFASGSVVPEGRFIQPRIETEIAFIMKAPLPAVDVTCADVLAATESIAPAIEILDTRIQRCDPKTGKARIITDTISDNAANAGIVLGSARHTPNMIDMRWVGAIVTSNGDVEETGLGAGVLNDPVQSVVWLAHRIPGFGQQIKAGDIILSGSFIRPLECPSGSFIQADFGGFGQVEIGFN